MPVIRLSSPQLIETHCSAREKGRVIGRALFLQQAMHNGRSVSALGRGRKATTRQRDGVSSCSRSSSSSWSGERRCQRRYTSTTFDVSSLTRNCSYAICDEAISARCSYMTVKRAPLDALCPLQASVEKIIAILLYRYNLAAAHSLI